MPAYTTDDRGNRIVALRPEDIRRAADADDPSRAKLARHLKNAIRVEAARLSPARIAWVIAAVVTWIALQIIGSLPGINHIPGIHFITFFGGIIGLAFIGREFTRRRVARMVAATAVAEGICGQCCYSLDSVPIDDDGCVTCPECGAAWSHDRITRPHWLADTLAPLPEDEMPRGRARLKRALRYFFTVTPKRSNLITPDDRGRFVQTPDSRFQLLAAVRRAEITEERIVALRKRIRSRGSILRALLCVPFIGVGLFAIVGALGLFGDREMGAGILVTCIALFFFTVSVAVNFGHSFLPPSHTARMLVANGLCGSCASSLAGLVPDEQGLCTCPKCGASWQVAPPQTQP